MRIANARYRYFCKKANGSQHYATWVINQNVAPIGWSTIGRAAWSESHKIFAVDLNPLYSTTATQTGADGVRAK